MWPPHENMLEPEDEFSTSIEVAGEGTDDEESTAPRCRKKRRRSLEHEDFGELRAAATEAVDHYTIEGAIESFYKISNGEKIVAEQALRRFATSMGWPQEGREDFFLLLYGVDSHTKPEERTLMSLSINSWIAMMESLNASNIESAVLRLKDWARQAYKSHDQKFAQYHQLVFTYLLVTDRPYPHRQFARTLNADVVKRALAATLGELSLFVHSFTQFLTDLGVKSINMDQWNSLLSFSLNIPYPTLEGYNPTDCWPVMIDDFVAWGVRNQLFTYSGVISNNEEFRCSTNSHQ